MPIDFRSAFDERERRSKRVVLSTWVGRAEAGLDGLGHVEATLHRGDVLRLGLGLEHHPLPKGRFRRPGSVGSNLRMQDLGNRFNRGPEAADPGLHL